MVKQPGKLSSLVGIVASVAMSACSPNYDTMPLKSDFELNSQTQQILEQETKDIIESESMIVQDENDYLENEQVVEFKGTPRNLFQVVNEFREKDNEKAGVSYPGLNGQSVAIISPSEINKVCGDYALACHDSNNVNYMPDNLPFPEFFVLLSHEVGHGNSTGNEEFVAVSNELYMALKSYQFMRSIGSLILPKAVYGIASEEFEKQEPFHAMYSKGRMFSILNLVRHKGDIEKAMNHVTNSKILPLEIDLDDKLAELESTKPVDQYMELWNELLDSQSFLNYLTSDRGHLNHLEAIELIDFLRLLNYWNSSVNLTNQEQALKKIKNLEEEYLDTHFNNPYFRAKVVNTYSGALYVDLINKIQEDKSEISEKVYNLSKKIIDANKDYPCYGDDPFICPKFMRNPRFIHVVPFSNMVNAAFGLGDTDKKEEACNYVIDFIEKFYPGVNFANGNFTDLENAMVYETNNYVARMALLAGNFYNKKDIDIAKKFYDVATKINCIDSGKGNFDNCLNSQDLAKKIKERL